MNPETRNLRVQRYFSPKQSFEEALSLGPATSDLHRFPGISPGAFPIGPQGPDHCNGIPYPGRPRLSRLKPSKGPVGQPGITLIELAVVAMVAIVLVGIGLPSFNTFLRNARLNGAARKIIGDIRYVQSLAVNKGGLYRFYSGADPLINQPGRYRIEQSNDGGATWIQVDPWYALSDEYTGVSLTSVRGAGSPGPLVYEVRYNSRGGGANPGADYPITITVTGQTEVRTIQIVRTGSVSLP